MDYRNLRNSINVISLHLFQADDGCLGSILKCGDKDYYDHDDYDHGSGGGGCDGGGSDDYYDDDDDDDDYHVIKKLMM